MAHFDTFGFNVWHTLHHEAEYARMMRLAPGALVVPTGLGFHGLGTQIKVHDPKKSGESSEPLAQGMDDFLKSLGFTPSEPEQKEEPPTDSDAKESE